MLARASPLSAGTDPDQRAGSFGYNKATKDEEYRSSKDMIHNLIDIVRPPSARCGLPAR